jgi:hypothetical protein
MKHLLALCLLISPFCTIRANSSFSEDTITVAESMTGTNLQDTTAKTISILQNIGRKVTALKVTSTENGRPAGFAIAHRETVALPANCVQKHKEFPVTPDSHFFVKVEEVLSSLRLANKWVYHFQLADFDPAALPSKAVFFYCD